MNSSSGHAGGHGGYRAPAPQLLERTDIGVEIAGQLPVTVGDNPNGSAWTEPSPCSAASLYGTICSSTGRWGCSPSSVGGYVLPVAAVAGVAVHARAVARHVDQDGGAVGGTAVSKAIEVIVSE